MAPDRNRVRRGVSTLVRPEIQRPQGPYMPVSDVDLLGRIAAGDRDAFAEFYDRHCGRVLGLLLRILRRRAEAEDALQECFLQVWSQAGRYRPERASVIVWLVLLARSRALDQLRRKRRDHSLRVAESGPLADAESATDAERDENVQVTTRALAQLPDNQRHAIRLAFYDGMTHEQIAASQRIPLGTVKTRIRRGMLRLREILSQEQKAVAS